MKRWTRGFCIIALAGLMVSQSSTTTEANWQKDATGWKYMDEQNAKIAEGWQKIDNEWYLFGSDGYMLTGWQQSGGKWYHMNPNGLMMHDMWIGDYYLNSDGTMAMDQWIDGSYVDETGAWVSGQRLTYSRNGYPYLTTDFANYKIELLPPKDASFEEYMSQYDILYFYDNYSYITYAFAVLDENLLDTFEQAWEFQEATTNGHLDINGYSVDYKCGKDSLFDIYCASVKLADGNYYNAIAVIPLGIADQNILYDCFKSALPI